MGWTVYFSNMAEKQFANLPKNVRDATIKLLDDLENNGPVRGNWPNYGKLSDNRHHCHLKKGHPCYVAVWEVTNNQIKLMEVIYLGTHEKAPY